MKHYFSKLLTEAERYGSSEPTTKWSQRLQYDPDSDYEDQPKRAKMCRRDRVRGDYKLLSDVLNPLYGLLEKNVGRQWNDVYSELCSGLDRRSVTGLHVFQHLRDYVDQNCWVGSESGKVWSDGRSGPRFPDDFYVHPWTGILCQVPDQEKFWWKHRHQPRAEKPVVDLQQDGIRYRKIDGIWYRWWTTDTITYEGIHVIHEHRRQLSKKDLKRLQIGNDPE